MEKCFGIKKWIEQQQGQVGAGKHEEGSPVAAQGRASLT
jgi:hypothetical protein